VKAGAKKADYEGVKIVSQNRAASYNYHILDKLEAGLILVGTEVKSLREGKGTLIRLRMPILHSEDATTAVYEERSSTRR